MKIYCSSCDKVELVRIDNCRDAKTNEPFQDIVCAECDLVIASGTGIALPPRQPMATNKVYVTREQLAELYPPPRQPLTDEEIWAVAERCEDSRFSFARAIEAAHGIYAPLKGEA